MKTDPFLTDLIRNVNDGDETSSFWLVLFVNGVVLHGRAISHSEYFAPLIEAVGDLEEQPAQEEDTQDSNADQTPTMIHLTDVVIADGSNLNLPQTGENEKGMDFRVRLTSVDGWAFAGPRNTDLPEAQ